MRFVLKVFKILLLVIIVSVASCWLIVSIPWFDSFRFALRYLLPGNTPLPAMPFTAIYDHNSWINGRPWPQQSGKITVSYDCKGHLFLQDSNDGMITIEDLVSKSIVQLRPHDKDYEEWLRGKNASYQVKSNYSDYVVQVRDLSPRLFLTALYNEWMFRHILVGGPRSIGEKELDGHRCRGWQFTVIGSTMECWFEIANHYLVYGTFEATNNQRGIWKLTDYSSEPLPNDYFEIKHYVKDLNAGKP